MWGPRRRKARVAGGTNKLVSIDIRILGSLEVERDGAPLPPSAGRDRRLLGFLVTRAGDAVAAERLIDQLWGERPPRTAAAALHNSVSRLRKTIGADVLQTRPAGYVLSVGAEGIDAARFERHVRESAGVPPEAAADMLRGALALWRGR